MQRFEEPHVAREPQFGQPCYSGYSGKKNNAKV